MAVCLGHPVQLTPGRRRLETTSGSVRISPRRLSHASTAAMRTNECVAMLTSEWHGDEGAM